MKNIFLDDVSWIQILQSELEQDYFKSLQEFLIQDRKNNIIYPPEKEIFNAFNLTPFDKVKVIILGQDPYHGPNQAHGLCFSVPNGVPKPPSLKNICKELQYDLNIPVPKDGSLIKWAQQGVLLLNATLTVRANQAGSHQKKGWEIFTDRVIQLLSEKKDALVFMLWGNYAQAKSCLIDQHKHLVLQSVHPSPLSASKGFLGCAHFSKANQFLTEKGLIPIDWNTNK